eukprot:TRINITY_DN12116_c0_g1_i1.p1 TRINITY_DN12116_c0_g1~~TRINITY_DN12116_c0_g1_i1.p1  ORF type:complete len:567 (+),score=138.30 TRINITY_DN12116_c0_g1_i1:76-1776(+)
MADAYPFYLGEWSWKGITATPEAQVWFDRGLAWMYGYNHEEAVFCFEKSVEVDPGCAMAYWCKAYCMGPNYNAPWDIVSNSVLAEARVQTDKATAAAAKGHAWEREVCEALSLRYPADEKPEDTQAWDIAFANALNTVADNHPDNIDLQTLAAESFMTVTPWKMWDLKTGEMSPAPSRTNEAITRLETAHKKFVENNHKNLPAHLGICHFYIHLMEMSPFPEKALNFYDFLKMREVGGEIGHLVHMGTHIGILCGDYKAAIEDNELGAKWDKDYVLFRSKKTFFILYYVHNLHFMMYGAMFAGVYKKAMQAAEEIWWLMEDEVLEWMSPWGQMAMHVEAFKATKYHVMVRFGKWEEILSETIPLKPELNCVTVATLHYARALAYALGRNDVDSAEKELEKFEEHYKTVPKGMGRSLHNNTGEDLLNVARVMANGEVSFRKGNHEEGLKLLRKAVEMEDSLPYDEPWGIMQPTRHALGALLLEAGQPDEALQVYKQDLGMVRDMARSSIHPDNLWAMLGVVDCSAQLKIDVDPAFKARLDALLVRTDTPIKASCFCRLSKMGCSSCA